MLPIRRLAAVAVLTAAAAALLAPPASAQQSGTQPSGTHSSGTSSGDVAATKTPTHNGVQSAGPQNPGGRLPESGHIPGAPGLQGDQSPGSAVSPKSSATH